MGNVAIINLTSKNKYFDFPVSEGISVMDRILRFTESLPEREKTVFLLKEPMEVDSSIDQVVKEKWTEEILFDIFREYAVSYDHIFYYWGDYPLLDKALTESMYGNHLKYYAGYTFADGYPRGLAPEILRATEIGMLYNLSRGAGGAISRNTVFEILQKDINAFDIETEISPVDLRMYRISLSCDTKRNSLQLKGLVDRGIVDRDSLLEKIDSCKDVLRTLPAYYQIQITDGCPQRCSYCPYAAEAKEPGETSSLEVEKYAGLLDRITDFSDDAYLALSAWGEPSLHNNIVGIIEETMKRDSLRLILETSGLGWREEDLKSIALINEKSGGRIEWIVSLDALDRTLYKELRGEGYDEAWQRAHRLMELFPGNCWVQAVRMKENEVNLEEFFRYWKEKTENIIVQKYDWFCGVREQKKITDLSPLNRDPCWHNKRDMFIRINGDVPLCREDLKGTVLLGNVFKDDLEKIWSEGEKTYRGHLSGEYSPLCRKCDEYYTFNF
ncbi:MAG: spiro-SPASM protein [Spirochaetales bacterium]|nr:spiro-SPASM protein [Spirochaetales bacterium]